MNNEELNKAAERYARESYPLRDYAPDLERKEVHEEQRKCGVAFKAGAEWMRGRMMKEAVEGIVHNFSSNMPHPTVLVDAKGFNQGDKVRIIIVKED